MKRLILSSLLLFAAIIPATAQVTTTWLQPTSLTTNMSVDLGPTQVMEVLSVAFDPASPIDIVMGSQKVTLGSGGNPHIPHPLVISGPSTVVFKKTSTGGQGS